MSGMIPVILISFQKSSLPTRGKLCPLPHLTRNEEIKRTGKYLRRESNPHDLGSMDFKFLHFPITERQNVAGIKTNSQSTPIESITKSHRISPRVVTRCRHFHPGPLQIFDQPPHLCGSVPRLGCKLNHSQTEAILIIHPGLPSVQLPLIHQAFYGIADRQHTTKPVVIVSITWGIVVPIRRTEIDLRIIVPRTTAQHTVALLAGIPIEAPFKDISGQIVKPVLIDSKASYWSGAVIGITVSIEKRTEIPCPIGRRPGISPRITG